jgi:hypothetical protein
MSEPRREGFWKSEQEPHLPTPAQGEQWSGQSAFQEAMDFVEVRLRPTLYRGFSVCRICKVANGNIEYETWGWRWPGGLRHYVRDHCVRPSGDFVSFILGQAGMMKDGAGIYPVIDPEPWDHRDRSRDGERRMRGRDIGIGYGRS